LRPRSGWLAAREIPVKRVGAPCSTDGVARLRLEVRREDLDRVREEPAVDIRIDGMSLPDAFDGLGMPPLELLYPASALVASEAPHYATVVRCGCGIDGCGSVTVRIRRDASDVTWDAWQSTLRGPFLDDMRFDATQYDAELARADQDRSWETTGERLARHLVARRYELEWTAEQWAYEIAAHAAHARGDDAVVVLHCGHVGTDELAWEIWVRVRGTADDAIAAFARGPRFWDDVEYYGRTRRAEAQPPPRAQPHWRATGA
jgi:hypothetical protein